MTVLYENHRRAKRARLSMMGAGIWVVGCLYWAHVLHSGGTRQGIVVMVALLGILPLVVLYFYGNAYVVRIRRGGDKVQITTLGVFGNGVLEVPLVAITEVTRPEVAGMTIRIAGRRTPLILDMQAEYIDAGAIAALAAGAGTEAA